MSREILFKAKRKDNGKWVEGYYCKLDETTYCISEDYERHPVPTHHYILQETMTDWGLPNKFYQFEIDPDTLSQYTGLTDKNGNKIWENDICDRKEKYPEIVVFNKGDWQLDYSYVFGKEIHTDACNLGFYVCERKCVEVIGNIFDNPELLEVE
jgi:uncharacterized phage protein (TIGR01671 family)